MISPCWPRAPLALPGLPIACDHQRRTGAARRAARPAAVGCRGGLVRAAGGAFGLPDLVLRGGAPALIPRN